MKRRQFISLLGGAAAWPLAARAQQARPLPRIGYLSFGFSSLGADAFAQGLRDFGYIDGQNVLVEYRRAGELGQLDALAAELVARKVEIIVCGGSQATRAALRQTKTIPIVTLSSNPVAVGFVASLANPGGNVTGVSLLGPEVAGKRLQLLKQLIPSIARVAVLWNPDDPTVHLSVEETQAAATTLALTLQILKTYNPDDIDAAVLAASNEHAEAIVLMPTPLFDGRAEQIAHLAIQKRLPTLYFSKEAVKVGILMSYGPDLVATIRRQAYFVDRILKGAKPGDLPVEEPTNSNWRSISTRRRRSASPFRRCCSPSPTRWSNNHGFCCGAFVRLWHFARYRGSGGHARRRFHIPSRNGVIVHRRPRRSNVALTRSVQPASKMRRFGRRVKR
jgi:putative ABC transport system substrate-binding protein